MTIQRFKRLKKSKKYQSLIRLFGVRTEPISWNSTKPTILFSNDVSLFFPKSDVISVPFSHLSAGRPLISFLLTFQVILSSFFLEYFPRGQRSSSNVLSHFFSFREETLLFQYSGQLIFAVSRLVHVLFFIFSVFLLIIYYLKKLFFASSIYILDPFCYLAGSVETSVIWLVLTSSGNYTCH